MKRIKTYALSVLLLCSFMSRAQDEKSVPVNEPDYNKPKIFDDLPQRMALQATDLEALFRFKTGESVNLTVTKGFILQGTVASTSDANGVKSVVIRSAQRSGATFTFTRVSDTDGSFKYIGRMLSRSNGDALELVHEKGQYTLVKKGLYDLISE
jgi:hypothetical protein